MKKETKEEEEENYDDMPVLIDASDAEISETYSDMPDLVDALETYIDMPELEEAPVYDVESSDSEKEI